MSETQFNIIVIIAIIALIVIFALAEIGLIIYLNKKSDDSEVQKNIKKMDDFLDNYFKKNEKKIHIVEFIVEYWILLIFILFWVKLFILSRH